MESYSVSCKESTENKNSSVAKPKENRLMFISNFPVCGKKTIDFY